MPIKLKEFYQSKKEFLQIHHDLKQTSCPHCQSIGNLILHGYLYGFEDKIKNNRILRGHRVFCSNRYRRKGCGKTFCILKSFLLKGFIINAKSLWQFFKNIIKGIPKIQAFKSLNLKFSNTTIYRLYKTFYYAQSHIRPLLLNRCPCPQTSHDSLPITETILHLKQVFKQHKYVFAAFQHHFQTSVI